MQCPRSYNWNCEKVTLAWQPPPSCQPIEKYNVQIKGSDDEWQDMPDVPEKWNQWDIANSHLMKDPLNLKVGDKVKYRIRACQKEKCGKWSDYSTSYGGARVQECRQ